MHGTVNPNGLETHYHFQYGTTTSYGSSTPEENAGNGTKILEKSAAIAHLEPGALYHYRLVASSLAGTSYGSDQTLITLHPESSSRWAILAPAASDDQWASFVSNTGEVCYWQLIGSWADDCLGTGNYVAKNTGLSALRDPVSGAQWTYFVSTEGRACYWQLVGSWVDDCLGTGNYVAPNTSVSAVRDPSSGDQWAYFVSSNESKVCYWQLIGSWVDDCLGTGNYVAPNTSVSAVRDPSSGDQWAYFVSKAGEVCYWQLIGSWADDCLGTGNYVAPNTSVSVVRDPATGNQWAYFLSSSGRVCYWGLNASSGSWTDDCLGSATEYVAKASGLAPVRDPETGNQWVYFISNVNQVCYWSLNASSGSWADNCLGTGEYVAPSSS